MTARACRFAAKGLGGLILLWQAGNAVAGRFVHPYLIPDLVVAALLISSAVVRNERVAASRMIAAFVGTACVFASATWSAIARDGFSTGRLMTAIGLLPCLVCLIALIRRRPRIGRP